VLCWQSTFGAWLSYDDDAMNIRVLGIVLLCLMVASCASRRSLAELEAEAINTGDWSAVERYKYMEYKMGMVPDEQVCRNGFALHCRERGKNVECTCASPAEPALRSY
jgi:hypothetical protein